MTEPRKNIQEMDNYIPPLEGRRDSLRLDFNENTVGPSPRVLEVLRKLTDADLAAYPEYSKFQKQLASYLDIKQDELLITNATDEAIMVVMQTYIDKGDEIILPIPTFAMFKFYAQIADANLTEVLYKRDLKFPTKNVLDKINKKTKLVVLCNPNNPTATLIEKKDIIKIVEKAASKDAIVLIDEAYYEFSKQTMIKYINQYNNLIVIRTFSKSIGLGGLRLGCAVANKEIIKDLAKVRSPYSINTAVIKAAEAALTDKVYIDWYVKEIEKGKKLIYEELKKKNIKAYPTTANFFLAKFKDPVEVQSKLREKGILVRDRSSYPLLKGCVRITIGTKNQMKQLAQAINELKLK
jgi:histidinol-phosphate aminotransferase